MARRGREMSPAQRGALGEHIYMVEPAVRARQVLDDEEGVEHEHGVAELLRHAPLVEGNGADDEREHDEEHEYGDDQRLCLDLNRVSKYVRTYVRVNPPVRRTYLCRGRK